MEKENEQQQLTSAGQGMSVVGLCVSILAFGISFAGWAFIPFALISLIISITSYREAKNEFGPISVVLRFMIASILIIAIASTLYTLRSIKAKKAKKAVAQTEIVDSAYSVSVEEEQKNENISEIQEAAESIDTIADSTIARQFKKAAVNEISEMEKALNE